MCWGWQETVHLQARCEARQLAPRDRTGQAQADGPEWPGWCRDRWQLGTAREGDIWQHGLGTSFTLIPITGLGSPGGRQRASESSCVSSGSCVLYSPLGMGPLLSLSKHFSLLFFQLLTRFPHSYVHLYMMVFISTWAIRGRER